MLTLVTSLSSPNESCGRRFDLPDCPPRCPLLALCAYGLLPFGSMIFIYLRSKFCYRRTGLSPDDRDFASKLFRSVLGSLQLGQNKFRREDRLHGRIMQYKYQSCGLILLLILGLYGYIYGP